MWHRGPHLTVRVKGAQAWARLAELVLVALPLPWSPALTGEWETQLGMGGQGRA